MDISIIIVNYNTCEITRKCIDSIFEHTEGVTYEVIVVDNNSSDNSREVLSNYPGIRFIQNDKNEGFGRANNVGFGFSTGKYVLLLNSDTYLLNNAVKCFYDEFEKKDSSVACIGSKLMLPDGSPNHSFQNLPSLKRDFINLFEIYLHPFHVRFDDLDERDYDEIETFKVGYITGADLCIRKEVIDQYGFFDPDFFMYSEEAELQHRYASKGLCSMIVSSPKIVHLEGASGIKRSFRTKKMYFTGRMLYSKKVYNGLEYLLYRIILVLSIPQFFASYFTMIESLKMSWFVMTKRFRKKN